MRHTRYKYLHGSDGEFHNPFDKGWRHNCYEAFHPELAPRAPVTLESGDESMALLKLDRVM